MFNLLFASFIRETSKILTKQESPLRVFEMQTVHSHTEVNSLFTRSELRARHVSRAPGRGSERGQTTTEPAGPGKKGFLQAGI